MVEVLLVLEIFLTENAKVEDLLCGTPSCSEACLFFGDDLLRLWLQSIQYDLQHDFAWVTDIIIIIIQNLMLDASTKQGVVLTLAAGNSYL